MQDLRVNSTIYSNSVDLVDEILEYATISRSRNDWNRIIQTRNSIADFSISFLQKIERLGLQSEKVAKIFDSIDQLRDGDDPKSILVLMTAHQPNLFAYSGVLRKIALISAVSGMIRKRFGWENTKVICFYGVADHDFANNKWVRSAEIESPPRKDGVLRYNVKLDREQLFLPSNKIPKPTKDTLESWKVQTLSWIREASNLARKLSLFQGGELPEKPDRKASESFLEFWNTVEAVWENSENLSAFSSHLISVVATEMCSEPILFANYSDCFRLFGPEYEWLIDNQGSFAKIVEENEGYLKSRGIDSGLSEEAAYTSPLWMKCKCGSKQKLSFSDSVVVSKCLLCQEETVIPQSDIRVIAEQQPQLFEPRSIAMPIVFTRGFGMACYVGGIGGLGYLLHSRKVSEKLNCLFPPTPFWYSPDRSQTLELLSLLSILQRIAKDYDLNEDSRTTMSGLNETADRMISEITNDLESGNLIKNSVTHRDLQLLQKIRSYSGCYPNLVEISVNFSFASIGEQWQNHLQIDGRLLVPVNLKSHWDKFQPN